MEAKLKVRLSPFEQKILYYMALGYSNGEIAEQFGYSIYSIKQYIHYISKKFGINNNRIKVIIKWLKEYKNIDIEKLL